MTKKLSIVIPAYREAAIIHKNLERVAQFLKEQRIEETTEVIVVAADGNDDTSNIVKKMTSKFESLQLIEPGEKVGKGRDVRLGFEAATGNYQLFMDADLATPLHHIPKMVALLEKNDMVIGVRNLEAIHSGVRSAISNFGNVLVKLILRVPINDTQCGFKGFKKDTAKTVFAKQTITGWGFDMEVIEIARVNKIKIHQMAISDWSDPRITDGFTHEKRIGLKVSAVVLYELLSIKLKSMRGFYKP